MKGHTFLHPWSGPKNVVVDLIHMELRSSPILFLFFLSLLCVLNSGQGYLAIKLWL